MAKKNYQSFHGYGIDVSLHRTDDLDKKALAHLQGKVSSKVLDLGCGALGFSKLAALVGVEVLAVDIADFSSLVETDSSIEFQQGDMRSLSTILNGREVTDVVLQRSFHYLEYEAGKQLLAYLHTVVSDKLFISVTGVESDIGRMYLGKEKALSDRFLKLTAEGQKTFQIETPVCLYTVAEFNDLLVAAGWKIDELWVSAFKNIKAVCSH